MQTYTHHMTSETMPIPMFLRPLGWLARSVFFMVLVGIILAGSASAQPVNDRFVNRTFIPSIPATVNGSTTSSTSEAGDPLSERSVWWKFTPQETGSYFISAYPNYTPYFRLYLFTGNSLDTLVKQNGTMIQNVPIFTWMEKFELTAGVEYSIVVGSDRDWDHGPVTLTLTRNERPVISVTNPTPILPSYVGEPLELRADASDPDGTVVRVDYYFDLYYQEGISQPVATSTVAPFSATVILPPAGNFYERVFAVATDNQGAKTISDSVTFLITHRTSNDFFSNRAQVAGERVLDRGDLQYATSEVGEPVGSKSIWWTWTAPASKTYVLSARGLLGGFQPRIDIYTGNSVDQLTSVVVNEVAGNAHTYSAQVELNATAGQTYAIRIVTVLGFGGETEFSIVPVSPPGTAPQIDHLRLTESGDWEMLFSSNSIPTVAVQESPDLKTWTTLYGVYPSNGYFKKVLERKSESSYFYRIIEVSPGP